MHALEREFRIPSGVVVQFLVSGEIAGKGSELVHNWFTTLCPSRIPIMRDHPDRIPLEKCQHGWLYRVYSRNLNLGVYRESDHGFIGIRHKIGARYLFIEYHWDNGPPFGTANPLELICECPVLCLDEYLGEISRDHTKDNRELFEWIEQQGQLLGIIPESC